MANLDSSAGLRFLQQNTQQNSIAVKTGMVIPEILKDFLNTCNVQFHKTDTLNEWSGCQPNGRACQAVSSGGHEGTMSQVDTRWHSPEIHWQLGSLVLYIKFAKVVDSTNVGLLAVCMGKEREGPFHVLWYGNSLVPTKQLQTTLETSSASTNN